VTATRPLPVTRPLPAARLPRLLAGIADAAGLREYERRYGPLPGLGGPPGRAGTWRPGRRPGRLIDIVEAAGLTGRGGAGFPAGRKMRSVAAGHGRKAVVANGAEGEPASRKDRLLLSRLPHLVLDGITLAAAAVGADEAYLCVHGTESGLLRRLDHAVAERQAAGLDPVPIQVTGIPARYVSSEQSSIVQYLNGGPGKPTFSPPRPHERGVNGKPTLVHNVETLAHLAIIARHGGRWFRGAGAPRGEQVLVAVEGLAGGPAVIRAFVPGSVLRHGVARAWLLLGGVGLLLLLLSVVVADQLARSLVRPLTALAQAADRLAGGELSARAAVAGPPEVRRAGAGLNRLAVRIGELLAHERETVADLSHRLRTPLTALRIDTESLRDGAEMERLLADVGAVERTVSQIIREARRPGAGSTPVMCDAARVVAERAAFWRPLAEDQDRRMTVDVVPAPVPVLVAADDLATCADILLGNVFAHTPEGAGFAVRLSRRAAGGAWLVIADDGPGFREVGPPPRGQSRGGSTGLGLDIARRVAETSGGTLTIGRSASGGGAVTLGLGFPAGPPEESRRHRRAGLWRRPLPRRAEQRGARRAPVPAAEQGDGPGGALPQP